MRGGGTTGRSETPRGRGRPPHSLLTARDVAERLHVPLRTVYAWTEQGRIPHVSLGRLIRYQSEDVDEIARRGLR